MIGKMVTKQTEWHRTRSFGGTGLTSWRSGKKIAATDQCVALILVCPRCYAKFVSTPEHPAHDCHEAHVDAAFRGVSL